jgi:hypothetical protein
MGAMREFKPLAKMNPILLNKPKQIIGMAKLKSFNAQLSIYIYPHAYPPHIYQSSKLYFTFIL